MVCISTISLVIKMNISITLARILCFHPQRGNEYILCPLTVSLVKGLLYSQYSVLTRILQAKGKN